MTLTLAKSPSITGFTHLSFMFKTISRFNVKHHSGLSDIVSIRSLSLYPFFFLVLKRNNSLSTDKELFPIGQKASSHWSKTSTLKQYSVAPRRERFSTLKYTFTSRSKTSALRSRRLTPLRYPSTPRRQTLTSRSKTFASLRYSFTPGRQTLTSGSKTFTPLKYSVLPERNDIFTLFSLSLHN